MDWKSFGVMQRLQKLTLHQNELYLNQSVKSIEENYLKRNERKK